MENQQKRLLFSKIEELRGKRLKHEKVISKLLSNQESTYRTPFSTSFSQNNQIVQQQFTNRSSTTNLSEQVNLQAHLLEAEWVDKSQSSYLRQEKGKTNWISVQMGKKYGDAQCEIGIDGVEGIVVGMDTRDFGVIAEYLTQTGMWQQIFIFKDGHYFANLFPNFSPANKNTLLLSGTKLEQCQMNLLILCPNGSVSIGYLLLHRLMSYLNSGQADHILQSLFGYPFFRYSLHNTSSFLSFSRKLQSLSSSTLLLAKSNVNNRISILDLKYAQQMQATQLLEHFSEISVCYEIENLFSEGVRIRHKRNHHAVIEIENGSEEEIELFVSFAANAEGKGQDQDQEFYRYCFIDEEGELVGYSQPAQCERQSAQIRIPGKSAFRMYVAEISRPNSSELSTFQVVFQSKKSLEHLHPSLSFKKEQNVLTETIINKYLSKCVNFDEIERQMIQLMQSSNVQITIVRVAIKVMGLAVDFISVREDVRDKGAGSFTIEYEDEEVLCDKMYRRKAKMINVDKAQIYQVYLSKRAHIKACSNGKFVFKQIHF